MENGNGRRIPDDFWDISSLTPKKTFSSPHHKDVNTVDVLSHPVRTEQTAAYAPEDTVIHRVISPEKPSSEDESFTACEQYSCTESLIHTVTLKKWQCSYHFYDEFLQDAVRYQSVVGIEAPYTAFFSYVPQYNQLSEKQMAFYLWWRENCRRGEFIKTDYSYLLLYIFELINLGAQSDVQESQRMLTELWKHYHEAFPALVGKLSRWICDFSLIHRLPPPANADSELVKNEAVLKEFYIAMPSDDMRACASSLLKYCASYDYRTSKFAKGEHLALYHEHMLGVLMYTLQNFRGEAGLLQDFSGGDSRMVRNAYEGALCCAEQKYRIEIEYCSFSRTNELRYLIGDILKYAENKLRSHLGIKSKLSVYSVTQELREVIDTYFALALKPLPKHAKKEEVHEYDVLYELPKKQFSLEDAKRIESESWQTTNELVTAFAEDEEENIFVAPEEIILDEPPPATPKEQGDGELCQALGQWLGFARAVLAGDVAKQQAECTRYGKMSDWVVDEINRIAVDVIGDVLIDSDGNTYTVLEDYEDML